MSSCIFLQIAENVKEFFHNEGIHSTTIQPEFVEVNGQGNILLKLILYFSKLLRLYVLTHLKHLSILLIFTQERRVMDFMALAVDL